jgi:hypothetical protein
LKGAYGYKGIYMTLHELTDELSRIWLDRLEKRLWALVVGDCLVPGI